MYIVSYLHTYIPTYLHTYMIGFEKSEVVVVVVVYLQLEGEMHHYM